MNLQVQVIIDKQIQDNKRPQPEKDFWCFSMRFFHDSSLGNIRNEHLLIYSYLQPNIRWSKGGQFKDNADSLHYNVIDMKQLKNDMINNCFSEKYNKNVAEFIKSWPKLDSKYVKRVEDGFVYEQPNIIVRSED